MVQASFPPGTTPKLRPSGPEQSSKVMFSMVPSCAGVPLALLSRTPFASDPVQVSCTPLAVLVSTVVPAVASYTPPGSTIHSCCSADADIAVKPRASAAAALVATMPETRLRIAIPFRTGAGNDRKQATRRTVVLNSAVNIGRRCLPVGGSKPTSRYVSRSSSDEQEMSTLPKDLLARSAQRLS